MVDKDKLQDLLDYLRSVYPNGTILKSELNGKFGAVIVNDASRGGLIEELGRGNNDDSKNPVRLTIKGYELLTQVKIKESTSKIASRKSSISARINENPLVVLAGLLIIIVTILGYILDVLPSAPYIGVVVTNSTGGYMWGAHTIIFYNNGGQVAENFSIKMRVANWNVSNGGIFKSGILEIDTLNNFTEIKTNNVTEPDGYWLEMTINSLAPGHYAAFEVYLNSSNNNDDINVTHLTGVNGCMSPVNQLPYFEGSKSCMDFSNLGSCNIPAWVKMPLVLTVNKTQQVFLTSIGNLSAGATVGGCPV